MVSSRSTVGRRTAARSFGRGWRGGLRRPCAGESGIDGGESAARGGRGDDGTAGGTPAGTYWSAQPDARLTDSEVMRALLVEVQLLRGEVRAEQYLREKFRGSLTRVRQDVDGLRQELEAEWTGRKQAEQDRILFLVEYFRQVIEEWEDKYLVPPSEVPSGSEYEPSDEEEEEEEDALEEWLRPRGTDEEEESEDGGDRSYRPPEGMEDEEEPEPGAEGEGEGEGAEVDVAEEA